MIHSFDAFELDLSKQELRKYGALVPIEPKAFRLITLLIENRERVVTKDELINLVWEGRAISDASVSTAIKSARRALGDNGQRQRFIKTVWGRGFRFVGILISNARDGANPPVTEGVGAGSGTLPSIAVMPFVDVSEDATDDHVAGGITDLVAAALRRMHWLSVIDRGSTSVYKSQRYDITEAADKLGAGYMVMGSVHNAAGRVRVTAQLLEGSNGAQIWSGRYDRQIDDLFDVHKAISQRIAGALEPRTGPAELARSSRKSK